MFVYICVKGVYVLGFWGLMLRPLSLELQYHPAAVFGHRQWNFMFSLEVSLTLLEEYVSDHHLQKD